MAENSLPLPDTFTHISVHMVHVLARLRAKRLVQEQLRNEGVRLSLVPPREINERATAYLRDHVEVWKEAIARAHKLDEMEGQRKDRQRWLKAIDGRLPYGMGVARLTDLPAEWSRQREMLGFPSH